MWEGRKCRSCPFQLAETRGASSSTWYFVVPNLGNNLVNQRPGCRNQPNQYILPHQRGQPGNQIQHQGNQGSGSGYNNYQGPQGNFHHNQSSGFNHQGAGSSQRQQNRATGDLVGELLNSQQNLQNNMMYNNDVVHRLQDAQQEQKAAMDMLTRQLAQIATTLNEIRGNDGKIPATVKMPDKANISQITLRSGKTYQGPSQLVDDGVAEAERRGDGELVQDDIRPCDLGNSLPPMADPFFLDQEPEEEEEQQEKKTHRGTSGETPSGSEVKQAKPYPGRRETRRKKEDPIDFMEIFGNRFIKDFIAGKAKADGKIVIGESVSTVIQRRRLPSKRTDPGMFTLPIKIGDVRIEHAMCDLGASINVLPYSVYQKLVGARLMKTKVVIQLIDRSCINPVGVLKNVIVKVHDFLYPADFHVIRMSEADSAESSGVLLGRPFLRTSKTLIDVCEGTICLDYHGEKYTFNIDEAMKKPLDVENLHSVDVISPLVQEYLEEEFLKEKFEGALENEEVKEEVASWCEAVQKKDLTDEEISEAIMEFCQAKGSAGSSRPAQLTSIEKALGQENQPTGEEHKNPLPQEENPMKELKKLPPGLKYAYLGEEEIMPIIINSQLT
ncbi:hypothetical protein AAHA92_00340 [Salvia divinorum]|uniref:Uncharacterized protein n=1 Tax=Salvia divinorum TaxID=28513 RepID=A0ABD1IJ84_SALDI